MKAGKILGIAFCTVALFSAVSLEAARTKTEHVLVPYEGTVAGQHLASGIYRVKCETNGATAKLTFVLDRKVVATVEGQLVNRNQHYSINQVVYDTKPDGTRAIMEIRFAKKNQTIVFKE